MTGPEPQKLPNWVGRMINIIFLTNERHTKREGVLEKPQAIILILLSANSLHVLVVSRAEK